MNPHEIAQLSPDDQQALDALIENQFDAAAVGADLAPRTAQLTQLLGLLEHLPEEPTGDLLTERTIQAVERARQRANVAQQIDMLSRPRGGLSLGFRLTDVAAVAAIFIVSLSLMWPMLESARATSRQIACQANLGLAGHGFATYAADHDGAMPATFFRAGDPWNEINRFDNQGNARSNSAHLLVGHRTGYMSLNALRCPENPHAPRSLGIDARDFPNLKAISYSYQNQYTHRRPRLYSFAEMAILADKNPVFGADETCRWELSSRTNSYNHTRRGQNVLMTDGRVAWLASPVISRDNIFHIGGGGYDYYTGCEAPADIDDAFLVP